MTKREDMDKEKRIDFFKEVLNGVKSWQSFAEAKNAALVGANIALVGLAVKQNGILSAITVFALGLAFLFSMWSFFPINASFLPEPSKKLSQDNEANLNLVFGGEIVKLPSGKRYRELVLNRYFNHTDDETNLQLEEDYADEIYINSRIAMNKYRYFKVALVFDIFAIIIMMSGYLYSVIQ